MTEQSSGPDKRSIWATVWNMPGRMALIGLGGILIVPPLMVLVGDTFLGPADTGSVPLGQVLYFIFWLLLVAMFVLLVGGIILDRASGAAEDVETMAEDRPAHSGRMRCDTRPLPVSAEATGKPRWDSSRRYATRTVIISG